MSSDIKAFTNACVFMWSVRKHAEILFEQSSKEERERMEKIAPVFFSDLNHVLNESVILQVCKLTDPPKTLGSENLTVDRLVELYGDKDARLSGFRDEIMAFRKKIVLARNKIIAHIDHKSALMTGALGAAPNEEWERFWVNLDEFVNALHETFLSQPMHFKEIAMASDADSLLNTLLRSP